MTLGDQNTDVLTFTGGLATTGNATNPSLTNLAGTVATTNTQLDLGAVTLAANATLKSGSGALNVGSVTDGASSFALSLQDDTAASTGTVTFNGAATFATLTTFGQAYAVRLLAGGTIDTDTNFLNTGAVTLGDQNSDVLTFTGGLATTGNATNPSLTNLAGTVATTNTQLDLGAVTLAADATLKSGSGALNVGSVTDGASSFSLSLQDNTASSTGTVTFNGAATFATLTTFGQAYAVRLLAGGTIDTDTNFLNTGAVTLGDENTDVLTFTGGLTATAPAVTLNGTVRTAGGIGILLGSSTQAVTLAGTSSLLDTTNNGGTPTGANIRISGALDGTAANVQALTLKAGTGGTVTFSSDAAVGGGTVLASSRRAAPRAPHCERLRPERTVSASPPAAAAPRSMEI